MINIQSIKNSTITFLMVNIFLISISVVQYKLIKYSLLINYLFNIFRIFLLIKCINYKFKDKEPVINQDKIIEKYTNEFNFNIIQTETFDFISTQIFHYYFFDIHENMNLYDLIYFVPISFLFELIFDFFHYVTHYLSHSIPFLYKNIHKKHHTHKIIKSEITFYSNPVDLFLTNFIPMVITIRLMPTFSLFIFYLIKNYKANVEISGHTGKKLYPISCFPQFTLLPKLLNIELYAEDHLNHHLYNNCNYSKRFSLYDKLFGTYKKFN
jgi:sterol desaturase/sphingolipid hydroxylase (fatty acid hydroxylase superfamily)